MASKVILALSEVNGPDIHPADVFSRISLSIISGWGSAKLVLGKFGPGPIGTRSGLDQIQVWDFPKNTGLLGLWSRHSHIA